MTRRLLSRSPLRLSPAFVIGSTGFVGRHLVDTLRSEQIEVVGLDRRNSHQGDRSTIVCDLASDAAPLLQAFLEVRPRAVFQLAASQGPHAADDTTVVREALSLTDRVLRASLQLSQPPTVVLVSSSAVYADSRGKALRESSPTAPVTMYGVSKVLVEAMGLRCFAAAKLPVIVARLFNVIGPGQEPNRAVAQFAKQILEIGRTRSKSPIRTQGLTAYRDLIDVRDAATALSLLARRGSAGATYNICSGRAVRMEVILRRMLKISDLEHLPVHAADERGVAYQRGDCSRLRALGWRQRVPLDTSLRDVLEEWRRRTSTSDPPSAQVY